MDLDTYFRLSRHSQHVALRLHRLRQTSSGRTEGPIARFSPPEQGSVLTVLSR